MRSILCWSLVLWGSMVFELTWPKVFPHGSLLLPLICGSLFWMRTAPGVLLAGLAFMTDAVARPLLLPLPGFVIPLLAAAWLMPERRSDEFRRRRGLIRLIPQPLHLPVLTLVCIVLQQLSSVPLVDLIYGDAALSMLTEALPRLLLVAIPFSGLLTLVIRLADELGFRRQISLH